MDTLPESAFVITKQDQEHALGSDELKPCPFCGKWAFSIGTVNEKTGNTVYHVNCTGRDCQAQSFYCAKDPAEARVKAIARWNRRHLDKFIKAVDDEQELPGDMPDEMWQAIQNDRDAVCKAMQLSVLQTKNNIRNRIVTL